MHFNPRSPCGERPFHAGGAGQQVVHFNPRSPCGERLAQRDERIAKLEFQSTLPVWGATWLKSSSVNSFAYFNPRSPCGERLLW